MLAGSRAGRTPRPARRAGAGAPLLPGLGRRVPRPRRHRRREPRATTTSPSSPGGRSPAWVEAQATPGRTAPRRAPRPHQGAVHRPLAARAGAGGRPLRRRAAVVGHGRRRGAPASPTGPGPWPGSRRAHARAVAGARRGRRHPRPRRRRPGRRGARVPAGVRVRPPRGALRPRRRRPPRRHRGRAGVRPHRLAQRRGRRHGRAGRPGPERRPRRREPRSRAPTSPSSEPGSSASPPPGRGCAGAPGSWCSTRPPALGGKLQHLALRRGRPRRGRPTPSWPGCPRPSSSAPSWASRPSWSPRHRGGVRVPRGRPAPPPPDQLLGVPTDVDALAASGMLSTAGVARARQDLVAPDDRPAGGADESVGDLVRRRLGDEVLDRLVGPLVGSIYAGDCDHLSLQVSAAQLAAARDRDPGDPSLVRAAAAVRAQADRDGPPRVPGPRRRDGPAGGRHHRAPGDDLRTGAAVGRPDPGRRGMAPRARRHPAGAVVVATPAFATAPLVAPHAPAAAGTWRRSTMPRSP